ncbi:MAG TPA: HAMP domain-containing sensor histidine kinase, partial [Acidimicrobiales bacterium]|nr:HAMP domain-containing sensor histidine kinase [Acidimicrobiales bacterium]
MSLRHRLLVGLLAVASVLVLTNVALSSTFRHFLLGRVDHQLVAVAERPLFRGGDGRRQPPPIDRQTLSEYYIARANLTDGVVHESTSALGDEVPLPQLSPDVIIANAVGVGTVPQPFTVKARSGRDRWRLVAVADRNGVNITVVGTSLADIEATIARLRRVQLAGTAAALLALGVVSWWMLRLGVHPIENMARTADAIAAGDLSRRVEHPGPATEAGRLGSALNSMLTRIEDAFRAREQSEDRVRRFAADASHELRTPLTSIRGYAELWRAGGLRDEGALGDAMGRIEAEASRMGTLVEDLLLLARLDQRRPLEHASVRLDEIARDAVTDARAVEPHRPIELDTQEVTVEGDEMRLRQVVGNLLANVRVHTPPATPVRVSVFGDADHARISVADRGPGMAPEVSGNVFERFFRADPSRIRSAGGTGLGLSIVAAIAEAHGGKAAVHSAPGEGSTFTVTLPTRTRTPPLERSPSAAPAPAS